jgi:hypothetical protein
MIKHLFSFDLSFSLPPHHHLLIVVLSFTGMGSVEREEK